MGSVAVEPKALFSQDGIAWHDGSSIDWSRLASDPSVVKLVIGDDPPPKVDDDDAQGKELIDLALPDLATLFPNLTHLHLWHCNVKRLDSLPEGLRCLDLRGCRELETIDGAGLKHLEELLLDGCIRLSELDVGHDCPLAHVSLKNCVRVPQSRITNWLKASSTVHSFDASGCTQLTEIGELPMGLIDLRLNRCPQLMSITNQPFPDSLRRLELRNAECLAWLPDFTANLDYVDLAYTCSLRTLPEWSPQDPSASLEVRKPRTLYLFESGIEEDRDLLGEDDTTNVAKRVHADRDASQTAERVADHELKLILLGNGRSGKSSFARRWVDGKFDENEKTTHGVLLWEKRGVPFIPENGTRPDAATLNIWDFAGQDLYHSTHRIFLQSKAIYLVFTTDHPPGADDTTDARERAAIDREGEDTDHPLGYWLEQVQSLGRIPGLTEYPPYLVIRSKADRGTQTPIEGSVSFSAKEGTGMDAIQGWIKKQIPKLLGRPRQRTIPKLIAEVKDELARLKAAHCQRIPLTTFDELVRRIAPDSLYAQRPELLLERLHRSGFLYYDAHYLPDDVVLDQRWVIQGIYCLTSRLETDNCREMLFRNQGRFRASQLRPQWESKGYNEEQQSLFLGFMTSCGMAYVVRSAEDTSNGETEYIAPSFLREKSELDTSITSIPDGARCFVVPDVSESDIIAILAGLGKEWQRDLRAWRWGCRFQAADTKTLCVLEYQNDKHDRSRYRWPLKIGFAGEKNRAFVDYVQNIVRTTIGNRQGLREEWANRDEKGPEKERTEVIDLASETLMHETGRRSFLPTKRIRVAFSFAGSDDEYQNVDAIPKGLAKSLKDWIDIEGFPAEVIAYGLSDEEERLREFIDQLCEGDLALIFWSKKYFDSKFCMREMQLFYEKEPRGRLDRKTVLIFLVDGMKLRVEKEIDHAEWERKWRTISNDRFRDAFEKQDKDRSRTDKVLKRDPIHPWHELVLNEAGFGEFIEAMLSYRFARDLSKEKMRIEDLLEVVQSHLLDPIALLKMANQQLERGHVEQAASLYSHAMARRSQGIAEEPSKGQQLEDEKSKFEDTLMQQNPELFRRLCDG